MHSLLRVFLFLVLVLQFGFWVEAQKILSRLGRMMRRILRRGKKPPVKDPELARYAIFEKSAPRPEATEPVRTALPLKLGKGARIAFIGNTLLDRAQHFGHFEAALQQAHPKAELVVRNLTWAADQLGTEPRPANFADVEQHLTIAKADVIFAAYGFNESFAGESGLPEFRQKLTTRMWRV